MESVDSLSVTSIGGITNTVPLIQLQSAAYILKLKEMLNFCSRLCKINIFFPTKFTGSLNSFPKLRIPECSFNCLPTSFDLFLFFIPVQFKIFFYFHCDFLFDLRVM